MATSDDDLDLAESEADPAVPFDHGSHLHPNPQWPVYPKPIGPAPKPPPPALLPMPRTANALCDLCVSRLPGKSYMTLDLRSTAATAISQIMLPVQSHDDSFMLEYNRKEEFADCVRLEGGGNPPGQTRTTMFPGQYCHLLFWLQLPLRHHQNQYSIIFLNQ